MRIIGIFIFTLLIIFGCSNEEPLPITYESLNISNFSVAILKPQKNRDFTLHNYGTFGIFESPDSSIQFSGKVNIEYLLNQNSEIHPTEINVRWISSIEGVIHEDILSDDYESNFSKKLSKGLHKILFQAYLSVNEELLVSDTITVSNITTLHVTPTDKSFKLNWSKYSGNDFESYLIYRDGYEPIAEIFDVNDTTYVDIDIVLTELYSYQIVTNIADNEYIAGSTFDGGIAGDYLLINHFVTKINYDRERNRIYALVGEQSIFHNYADEYGLLIIDLDDSLRISDHILKHKRYADLDLSPDNKYLFLCNRREDVITRINLNDLEVTEFNHDFFDWGVHKIEVGDNYRLYCHRDPPTSGTSPLFILDGITGEILETYYSLIHGDIEFNSLNSKLYHSTSLREKWVLRYSVANDQVNQELKFAPAIHWPRPFLLISDNGENIFWEHFQLDKDLNVIREFNKDIINIDHESNYISDGSKIMKLENLDVLFEYPGFPHHDTRNEIISRDNTLIICNSGQPYTNRRNTYFFKMKLDD